ncbi:MAG: D-alanyl-D-alanine carboxypeptidase family protein [Simkaniaceae bacterium]
MAKPLDVKIRARSGILMNADTGAILYQKNAHETSFPASITKIATALYVLEKQADKLDTAITFPNECLTSVSKSVKMANHYSLAPYLLEPDGTHYYIKRGEEISIRDLLYGLLIKSGNDAANVLAHHTSGSIVSFMKELNLFLKGLGCKKTRFHNPHGLHHPFHITTAYEMALITKEALKNPYFQKIVAAASWTRQATNKQKEIEILQNNKLLRKDSKFFYDKAIGVKTGYTQDAGPTIVAAARDKERTLIAVLLGYSDRSDRYRDAIHLFETAFLEKKISRCLFAKGDTKFSKKIAGGKSELIAGIKDDVIWKYYPSEEEELETELEWKTLKPPIKEGVLVGKIILKDQRKNPLLEVDLFSQNAVDPSWGLILQSWIVNWIFMGLAGLACLFGGIWRKIYKQRKKIVET